MALADGIQGSVRPSQTITWMRDEYEAENLTGATITGKIIGDGVGATSRDIAGTLTVIDGANGEFRWDYDEDDVATAGNFLVQFTATFASGLTPAKTKTVKWKVHKSIS